MQISTSYTAASLSVTGTDSETVSSSKRERGAASGDRVTLSDQSRELAFSLDLEYQQLSVTAESDSVGSGPDGEVLAYTGISAELSTFSASFTMTSTGDSAGAGGKGTHLNDEVSQIARGVKPLVKEFFAGVGVKGGWGQVNRLLRFFPFSSS